MNEMFLINMILLFTFTMLYLGFSFSQELSKDNTFYGIYLEEKYKQHPNAKKIKKAFHMRSLIVFLMTSILTLFLLNITKSPENPLIILVPLVIQIVLYFCVYLEAYRKVRSFKASFTETKPMSSKTIIDTDFISAKTRLKKIYIYLYSIPMLIALGLMAYTFYKYPELPNKIPVHWNHLGEIDAWAPKTYMSVLFPTIMQVFLVLLLAFATLSVFTSRIKLDASDIEASKTSALNYLKGIALGLYFMTLSIISIFAIITLAGLKGINLSTSLLWVTLFGPLFGILIIFYSFIKYGYKKKSKEESPAPFTPEDEDQYWILGFLYNNPNDPAVMVQKRYGLGWTLNIGNTIGKLLLIILLVFILSSLFLPFFLR